MRLGKFLTIAVAASMSAVPALAADTVANPAAKLSLAPTARAAAKSNGKESSLVGGSLILVLIAGAAVVAGIVAATDHGGSK